MGEALRRRLFRRVTVVRFAVAIAAAERGRRDSSHGDIEMLQTITLADVRKDNNSRTSDQSQAKTRAKKDCLQAGWVDRSSGGTWKSAGG